jgi:hypothetical protein
LLRNRFKTSASKGGASFEDLRDKGILIEAIVNSIALLGWSPGNDRALFTLKELEEAFTLNGIKQPSPLPAACRALGSARELERRSRARRGARSSRRHRASKTRAGTGETPNKLN